MWRGRFDIITSYSAANLATAVWVFEISSDQNQIFVMESWTISGIFWINQNQRRQPKLGVFHMMAEHVQAFNCWSEPGISQR